MRIFFLTLLGIFLSAQEQQLVIQACDEHQKPPSALQGNFLKDDKLQGEMCEHHFDSSTQEEATPDKNLDELKAFINAPKSNQLKAK